MEQLLVRLGCEPEAPVHWLVWSQAQQEIIASGELPDAASLSTLSERAGQRPVIGLVPTSDVLLKWVELPPRAGRKVINAIPYMLEDELAQDISEQFFAYGPRKGDQQAVAVVSKLKMAQWQQWLADADLFCDKLLPDVLAVPMHDDAWSALTVGDELLLRRDTWSGMQGEAMWLEPALAHFTKGLEAPLDVYNYSTHSLSHLPNLHEHTSELDLPMNVLAKQAIAEPFNLFQGDYKIKRKRTGTWQQWRIAAVLAVLALGSGLIDKVVTLQQLKATNDQLNAQIDDVVKARFPDLGPYRDVKRRITSEMATLENGGAGVSMLVMLDQLTPAFSSSRVKPQTLRFDSTRTEIRMQAAGRNFEALESFRRQAEAAGFSVEQGAINNRDDEVVGTLAIRSES